MFFHKYKQYCSLQVSTDIGITLMVKKLCGIHCIINIKHCKLTSSCIFENSRKDFSNAGLTKRFDPKAEFATAWPLEGWKQCDLHDRSMLLHCCQQQKLLHYSWNDPYVLIVQYTHCGGVCNIARSPLTLWEPAYDIFVLRVQPKKQQLRLPYQRHSSSADCARELFKGLNGSDSLLVCTRKLVMNKTIFFGWGCGFFETDIISEVVLGSFWLMLPGLGPNC